MTQRTSFWILLVATIGYALFMKQAVAPLSSNEIVAYELVKTPEKANALLNQFGNEAKISLVRQSLYLDFVFLVLYGSTLFVGCRYATELARQVGAQRTWVRLSYGLAWLGIVALLADAAENVVLLRQLPPGIVTDTTTLLAWAMASLKFISILFGIVVIILNSGYYGLKVLLGYVAKSA
ncbi:MAG: hypothetical protein EOO39_40415 [Cytophagaceae bacterium]|nr:MAG: hypothetical protein EOO39_40415 [Cytophagaceae bacterium]